MFENCIPHREILVCSMDNLPFYVETNRFTPVTSDQLVSIFRRYLWPEDSCVYMRQFYQTIVVPVYCFILGIDEMGNKCICKFYRHTNDRREEVEWFPGGLVHNVTYKSETTMSSIYDAITYSVAPRSYQLEDEPIWLPSDRKRDAQSSLSCMLDWWSILSSNMYFSLFKRVDIDQLFMISSIEGTGRNQSAIYCGGLVILMVLPISTYKIGTFVPIPSNVMNRLLKNNGSFIPKDELLRLDEVTGFEDVTCPLIHPFLDAIIGVDNPYF